MAFWDEEEDTKYCPRCDQDVPLSNFRIRKEGRGLRFRYYTYCLACEKDYSNELAEVHRNAPDKPDVCECCGKKVKLVLDHDHTNNVIRGYICHPCNIGIDRLGDNLEGVMNAIKYLSIIKV